MKRLLPILALTLTIACASTTGSKGLTREMVAAEARRFSAMTRGDLGELETLLANDLVYTHSNGRVESKAELLDALRSGRLRYLSIQPSEHLVRLYGRATVVVTGRSRMSVEANGQQRELDIRYLSIYLHQDGDWRLVRWQSTRVEP